MKVMLAFDGRKMKMWEEGVKKYENKII